MVIGRIVLHFLVLFAKMANAAFKRARNGRRQTTIWLRWDRCVGDGWRRMNTSACRSAYHEVPDTTPGALVCRARWQGTRPNSIWRQSMPLFPSCTANSCCHAHSVLQGWHDVIRHSPWQIFLGSVAWMVGLNLCTDWGFIPLWSA